LKGVVLHREKKRVELLIESMPIGCGNKNDYSNSIEEKIYSHVVPKNIFIA